MAPDRAARHPTYQAITADGHADGHVSAERTVDSGDEEEEQDNAGIEQTRRRSEARDFLAEHADEGQNFTLRGVLVGLAIGVIICFSNMYFGLQTGWISGMAMPSALIGFAFFKSVARYIDYPFTPVENVLVQTVAGALGTMPLGCGFVGVIPALEFLLKSEENGPLLLGTGRLIVWALGVCLFGVVFAVPLRREVIIREKLKFPSGTATALMIGVLHGNGQDAPPKGHQNALDTSRRRSQDAQRQPDLSVAGDPSNRGDNTEQGQGHDGKGDWKSRIRLLVIAFGISALYVCYYLAASERTLMMSRHWCHISFPRSMISQSWAYLWQRLGSGLLIPLPLILVRAS